MSESESNGEHCGDYVEKLWRNAVYIKNGSAMSEAEKDLHYSQIKELALRCREAWINSFPDGGVLTSRDAANIRNWGWNDEILIVFEHFFGFNAVDSPDEEAVADYSVATVSSGNGACLKCASTSEISVRFENICSCELERILCDFENSYCKICQSGLTVFGPHGFKLDGAYRIQARSE